jgi:hypothetical protein
LQEVLNLSGASVVVVGMSSRVHLRENLGALESGNAIPYESTIGLC